MAAPSHYSQGIGNAPQEDCRDFLRTGRCKYGASCKYNHPSNVQSGGGMKTPIDPSEPMFPVRPNEPNCQYYMKHGTCKFGQACKFHHPPQSAVTSALLSGNTVVMNVGGNSDLGNQQILFRSASGEAVPSSGVTLQFLPQRPDEPNCIYFLRNGRCKYGATCRYHHPVAVHQRRHGDSPGPPPRRQQQTPPDEFERRSTVAASRPTPSYSQSAQQRAAAPSKAAPTHFVISDGQFAVIAVNDTGNPGTYRQVGIAGTNDGATEYCIPVGSSNGPGMRHDSSSSSIASSYETASSSFEYLAATAGQARHSVEVSSAAWARKRVGSGGSLNTLTELESTGSQFHAPHVYGTAAGNRVVLVPSRSDNSLASSSRHRAPSIGSVGSDNSASFSDGWNAAAGVQPGSNLSGRGWPENSTSYEHQSRRLGGNPHNNHAERLLQPTNVLVHPSVTHIEENRAAEDSSTHEDDGLSMMTSALLNMLDTPEDAARKSYPASQSTGEMTSPPSTPRTRAAMSPYNGSPQTGDLASPSTSSHSGLPSVPNVRMSSGSRYQFSRELDSDAYKVTGNMVPTLNPPVPLSGHQVQRQDSGGSARHSSLHGQEPASPRWSPTWHASSSHSQQLDHSTQAMSVIQHQTDGASSQQPSSNVGLYLP